MGFTHLHVHTDASLLDGISTPESIAAKTAELGMKACAITDHGSLVAAIRFDHACRANGVTPIIGQEFYLALGDRFEKNTISVKGTDATSAEGEKTKRYEHITLLAASKDGWESLTRLNNASWESYWYTPRIDYDLMTRHSGGLICLTGCLGGPVLGPLSRYAQWIQYRDEAAALAAGLDDGEGVCRRIKNGELSELEQADSRIAGLAGVYQRMQTVRDGRDGYRQARENLARLISIYGRERVFVELMEHGIPAEQAALPYAVQVAGEMGVKCVATNDSHYTAEKDAYVHDGWIAMRTASSGHDALNDPARFRFHGDGYWLRSEQEMRDLRPESWWAQACDNTMLVAGMIDPQVVPEPGLHIPRFPPPHGYTTTLEYFKDQVTAGARSRYGEDLPVQVKERLAREIRVIHTLGLVDYFLIDSDLIAWARSDWTIKDWITRHDTGQAPSRRGVKTPILVGPGRGSGGGSIVLYCLGITAIDPLRHGLFFERFLDVTRIGMPDVDTDFEQERRDEAYEYLAARYGSSHVARLGAIGTKKVRAAIKDGFRLVGLPDKDATMLTKRIPDPDTATIRQLLDPTNPAGVDFRTALDGLPYRDRVRQALTYAAHFEGLTSHLGIHACGILVSDRDINTYVPTRSNTKNSADTVRVTLWDGKTIDTLGLLKLDLLGLRTLDIIHTACDIISRHTGTQVTMDSLPDPDSDSAQVSRTWRMLTAGETAGVFQLESDGMTHLIEQIRPHSWAHITAAVALYRPGPLQAGLHTHYADRLNNRETVDYQQLFHITTPDEHAIVTHILGETFGIPVYQEQAMALARDVAGFDEAWVNIVRKAISKKQQEKFAEIKQRFLHGAVNDRAMSGEPKVSFTSGAAERLWEAIEGSAQYSFNKSHSVAYGLLSFYTAFLKANYPAAFGAAVLAHTDRGDTERRSRTFRFLNKAGVTLVPPDVNTAHVHTTALDSRTVMLGLADIKDVGVWGEMLVCERDKNGPYESVHDIAVRVAGATVNHVYALIESGACDTFGTRKGLAVTAGAAKAVHVPPPDIEWDPVSRWIGQKNRLGVGFGVHPLDVYRPYVDEYARTRTIEGRPLSDILVPISEQGLCGRNFRVVGVIDAVTVKAFPSGRAAFMEVSSPDGVYPVTLWSRTLAQVGEDTLTVGALVDIAGYSRERAVEVEDVGDDGQTVLRRVVRRDWVASSCTVIDTSREIDTPVGSEKPSVGVEESSVGLEKPRVRTGSRTAMF